MTSTDTPLDPETSIYQLENSGDGPMAMLLNRSGASAKKIDYETRKEVVEHQRPVPTDA